MVKSSYILSSSLRGVEDSDLVWKSLNLSADFGFAVEVMQPNANSARYVARLNHILLKNSIAGRGRIAEDLKL